MHITEKRTAPRARRRGPIGLPGTHRLSLTHTNGTSRAHWPIPDGSTRFATRRPHVHAKIASTIVAMPPCRRAGLCTSAALRGPHSTNAPASPAGEPPREPRSEACGWPSTRRQHRGVPRCSQMFRDAGFVCLCVAGHPSRGAVAGSREMPDTGCCSPAAFGRPFVPLRDRELPKLKPARHRNGVTAWTLSAGLTAGVGCRSSSVSVQHDRRRSPRHYARVSPFGGIARSLLVRASKQVRGLLPSWRRQVAFG